MKKSILNLGKAITKADQKTINGGFFDKDPCPCSSNYVVHSDGACSYVSSFPGSPFRCYAQHGPVNGLCCE